MSNVSTFSGSVVSINGVQLEDDVVTLTISLSRETTDTETWGGSDSGLGSLKGTGSGEVIYNETAASPYMTIEDEMFTPTAGGLPMVFRPDGTTSGNREWTMNVKISDLELGGSSTDNKKGVFKVSCSNISRGTQI